jgi:hypothetical protein
MKNSNDTIGNRSRDLPVCSTVPQPLRHRVPPTSVSTDHNNITVSCWCSVSFIKFVLYTVVLNLQFIIQADEKESFKKREMNLPTSCTILAEYEINSIALH